MITSRNPADGSTVWEGEPTPPAAIPSLLQAAHQAQQAWQKTPMQERVALLHRFRDQLKQSEDALAELISREAGKPLWESRTEVAAMQGKIDISVEAYERRCATFSGGPSTTRFRPHGVVAVFGPFNFPGHLPNGHIVPALIAGNAVVFKPSDQTPAVAEMTLRCWKDAGLPDSLIQIVHGGAEQGRSLSENRAVNGVFFTGSEKVGLQLARTLAETPGRILALELGGNNPLVVHEAADRDAAIVLTLQSAFLSAGQRCTCANRLIVPEGTEGDLFLADLAKAADRLRVDVWNADPAPFMGPVISPQAADRVMEAQRQLEQWGGRALLSCRRGNPESGFVTPGIIDVTAATKRQDEEVFGPLLQIIRTRDFDSAIEEANNTRFGLAAGLLSDNRAHYDRFHERVRAGIINWNQQLTGASSAAPFGGVGHSGNFRPSAFLAADYCAYPVASIEIDGVRMPASLPPGLKSDDAP